MGGRGFIIAGVALTTAVVLWVVLTHDSELQRLGGEAQPWEVFGTAHDPVPPGKQEVKLGFMQNAAEVRMKLEREVGARATSTPLVESASSGWRDVTLPSGRRVLFGPTTGRTLFFEGAKPYKTAAYVYRPLSALEWLLNKLGL